MLGHFAPCHSSLSVCWRRLTPHQAVTAGAPIGGIFFSLLLRKLFATFDWQRSMYIVSSTIGFFLGLGMLMVRSKPQPRTQLSWSFGHFKSLSFVLFTFAVFCKHFIPFDSTYLQYGHGNIKSAEKWLFCH